MTTVPMDQVFADILRNCADDNGQIRWSTAVQAAKEHGRTVDDFRTEYGVTAAFGGVDVGEVLIWLGY